MFFHRISELRKKYLFVYLYYQMLWVCHVIWFCKTITKDQAPQVIKLFSCSALLSMEFVLLVNLKLLTISNSFLLNIAEHENVSANKYENANYCWHSNIYEQRIFHAQPSWSWKKVLEPQGLMSLHQYTGWFWLLLMHMAQGPISCVDGFSQIWWDQIKLAS